MTAKTAKKPVGAQELSHSLIFFTIVMRESLVFIRPAERRKLLTVALTKTFVWSSSKTLYFLYTYHRHLFLQHWLDPFKHDLDHYFKRETLNVYNWLSSSNSCTSRKKSDRQLESLHKYVLKETIILYTTILKEQLCPALKKQQFISHQRFRQNRCS